MMNHYSARYSSHKPFSVNASLIGSICLLSILLSNCTSSDSGSDKNDDPLAEFIDSDSDGVNDRDDAFPDDPNESVDSDRDGIGDNADTDRDGDGVDNSADMFADDANESTDTDGDGIGNNEDKDDDDDGFADVIDAFPEDPNKFAPEVPEPSANCDRDTREKLDYQIDELWSTELAQGEERCFSWIGGAESQIYGCTASLTGTGAELFFFSTAQVPLNCSIATVISDKSGLTSIYDVMFYIKVPDTTPVGNYTLRLSSCTLNSSLDDCLGRLSRPLSISVTEQ